MRFTDAELMTLAQSKGLDPFPTEFHIVPAHVLYDVAARGMPGRYAHWAHGKDYWHQITRHEYGASRIYEVVVNSNPSLAFLLDANSDVINLMVRVHVLAHTDFFKHNRMFAETDRDMPERAALRAERIRGYEEKHGQREVEKYLDALLTMQFYVDPDGYDAAVVPEPNGEPGDYADILSLGQQKVSPPTLNYTEKHRFSGLPCHDILGFLIQEAPMEDWQRDLAEIVREDGLYFWPQIRTKVVNEGWASLWHTKLMHSLKLTDGEFVEFAKVNAGVVSPHLGSLNPYWLGLKILADIEKRFGVDKLFEVRRMETDVSLIRNYLTKELVEELGLIRYGFSGDQIIVTEHEWEKVRDGIANDFACPFPSVAVVDKNWEGDGGLLLRHYHDGRNLKSHSVPKVLEHLKTIWHRRVCLESKPDRGSVGISSKD